ncbi:protease inhibitor I42 family protein [Leptolyngbya sp. FACHB-321]|uniref:protease inhibitor I42 family protein n=1 Tax=Leptolyngbya sp. FACHB-321 TaxID=2692807 RepID=UPI0016866913|nr:protease inhibitor I42 family protein [Leptolyngbya sp. FACHB-321]MBD2038800.1 protease inhibitor I42 family protein [Leptolyngbya sp. FACHB-321]
MDIPTSLSLEVGETYSLTLPGLATAGYQWTYEMTHEGGSVVAITAVPLTASRHESAQPAIGTNRDESFEIQALKAGQATLRFKQARSWEENQPPLKEYQIEVVIR